MNHRTTSIASGMVLALCMSALCIAQSSSTLVLAAQDSSLEDGELWLVGAPSYPAWHIDVYENRLLVFDNTAERLAIVSNTGKVGIGTSSPASN